MDFKKIINLKQNKNVLKIRVIPNSKENWLVELMSNWVIKIKLKQVPKKWKANNELIKFISEKLEIPKSNISIISWFKDKNKIVKIDFL